MKARDVMTARVITTSPGASIKSVVETFVRHQISAAPVVDANGKLVGIISEGDLLHRAEAGTEKRHPWWLRALMEPEVLANEYAKAHARKVADAMTSQVVATSPDTPIHEVAALLEKHSIKRVPIVENGQLVGVVSRANLVQATASAGRALEISPSELGHSRQTLGRPQGAGLGTSRLVVRHGERRCSGLVGHCYLRC